MAITATAVLLSSPRASVGATIVPTWTRQFGTSSNDQGLGVAIDPTDGSAVIAGYTQGALAGPSSGSLDGFVAKYSDTGMLLWTRQRSAASAVAFSSVTTDNSGNIYAGGVGDGALMVKMDPAGNTTWARQLGSGSGNENSAVATDHFGNVFFTGNARGSIVGTLVGLDDVMVGKYDAAGNLIWAAQYGTSVNDYGTGIASGPAGSVFVTGYSEGGVMPGATGVGGYDSFITKFDASGNRVWTHQFGSTDIDLAKTCASDATGNLYVAGYTSGNMAGTNAGVSDVFVSKFDSVGNAVWTRQFGESGNDYGTGLAIDVEGNVIVSGSMYDSAAGPNRGPEQAFVRRFDPLGNLKDTYRVVNGTLFTVGGGVAFGDGQHAYLTGFTSGSFGSSANGGWDPFVVRLPEPASICTVLLATIATVLRRKSHRRHN